MQYLKPTDFESAREAAAQASGTVRFLAGGTDVLVQLRADIVTPDLIIDLKGIPGVNDVTRESDGSWSIGAAVPGAVLTDHEELSSDWPGVIEAMGLVGSTQVQGRATLAGNLCNASPAADSVPAMIAAGAEVSVLGAQGMRRVRAEDVATGPGQTSLEKGEVITAVHLPARGPDAGDAYLRFIPRTEMDIAVVGCGVNLRVDMGRITEARVALGAVAPTALLVPEAADALVGSSLDEGVLEAMAAAATAACNPIDDKRGTADFRRKVAGVMGRRVAAIAYARATRSATE
jgi:carbon-monoxide dehydrogenase medium subunit